MLQFCVFIASSARLATLVREILATSFRLLVLRFRTERSKDLTILVLEKQLAGFLERGLRPRLFTDPEKLSFALLSRLAGARDLLRVVTPRTVIAWERKIMRWSWWLRSRRRGRPLLPAELRAEIRRMARENPTWTAGRIAREIQCKAGIFVDEATVRKYMPAPLRRRAGRGDQRWSSFIRNHAQTILACDFAVVMRAGLRPLFVFVVMEIASRRIAHIDVTSHPTAEWTLGHLREAIPGDSPHRYLVHDNDSIFSADLDASVKRLGVNVLKTPFRAPRANSFCERLVGTLRRECLDWFIPLTENQVRAIVREWSDHYNRGRPHMSLGSGVPDAEQNLPVPPASHRHRLPDDLHLVGNPVLGGLHHDYRLELIAA